MRTILIIVAVFVSTSLFAVIINVPADTSTIQGGIYLASTGDTVLVAENTYYENNRQEPSLLYFKILHVLNRPIGDKSMTYYISIFSNYFDNKNHSD